MVANMDAPGLDPQDLEQYCERVGLSQRPDADLAGLSAVQAAHQQGIGFENLDIRLGRAIAIEGDAVFDKLVRRGRGGYCFEKNRLLGDVLTALGIPNRPLLARPLLRQVSPDGPLPARTHQCLLARIEGRDVVADAGFGGSIMPPMLLEDGYEARAGDGALYRLRRIGEGASSPGEYLLERQGAGPESEWQRQYALDLQPVAPADLAMANHWTATRPGVRFTSLHIVSIGLPDGHAALTDRELSITRSAATERRLIDEPEDYARTVRELFRIALTDAEAAALPLFARTPVTAP